MGLTPFRNDLRGAGPIALSLCGDVMTGRGIDQVLPYPGNPLLHETYVRDAREYVRLAERFNGPIDQPMDFADIWGDALHELEQVGTDLRIVNLETSITSSEDAWPGKRIHYRMHPRNVACLVAGGIDCCCLANNHVLDWGYAGLNETLSTLEVAGIASAGAGSNAEEACSPVVLEVADKGRVLIISLGSRTSGIPRAWGATAHRPGVHLLEDLSERTVDGIAGRMQQVKRAGDVIVVSIHWGANWGYEVPDEQIRFAHRLIDEGADVIHGHSSHHAKAIEIYRERLILYGSGDFVDDYEGIGGYENFRDDLRLMFLVHVDSLDGRLLRARIVPFQARQFRLGRASDSDVEWLGNHLSELGRRFSTSVHPDGGGLVVRPG